MSYLNELRNEEKQQKLFKSFNVAYERDFAYEILFRIESALLTIKTHRGDLVGTYIVEDFDFIPICPGEDYISERYYGVTDEKCRKIYLTFMKNIFPNYKDDYIKNLEKLKNEKIEELNSL